MRRVITVVAALLVAVCPFAAAQQAGENINVLPVIVPVDADENGAWDDPAWFIKGDGYLQRQVEPTIAASTLNPDHLLAFFVDYRAVDIQDDIGLGQSEAMMAVYNTTRTVMMAASGLCLPTLPHLRLAPIAATEAWVGMSRSYDGGLTWSGGFLPGAPFDTGDGGNLVTPIDGLQAATDPVLAPGPCGKFYLVFMAFTRGGESKLVVARYLDHNYAGGGEHITYEGMTVIESGNNATHGYFLDKPDIEVDVFREFNADICADRVYVSYSTFNGLDKDGKFQSKVSFARSFDGGLTFETQKLNPPYNQNQGSALAVDPSDGTVYMFWRHFWAPDAILMVKSTDYGKKWSKPVNLTEAVPMVAFDQPSISVGDALAIPATSPVNPGFPEVAFRSNGFPTAAVATDNDQSTLFVAWQERVDVDPDSGTFRQPLDDELAGRPRIVVVRSDDGGTTWRDIANNVGARLAVDTGLRDSNSAELPAPGHGILPQVRPAGSQVQPKLVFSGGQLLLAYYESRGRIVNYGSGTSSEELIPEVYGGLLPPSYFISGYDRQVDFRAALLNPSSGAVESTIQVSRYPIRGDATLVPLNPYSEDFTDVAPVNWPCTPDAGSGYKACIRQTNRANAVQSASGSTPFIGDYPDVAPVVQFVFDGTQWKWATSESDVPYRGFHAIFTDNRHLIPPAPEIPPNPPQPFDEWEYYDSYSPPFRDPCINAGSRNTDVLTSKIDMSLVLSAPTTYKNLDYARGFPFTVKNTTGATRTYRIEIEGRPLEASFVRADVDADQLTQNDDFDTRTVDIFAYSSTSLVVYVAQDFADPVRIHVSEDCSGYLPEPACTNASGTLTFNLDSGYDQTPYVGGADTQYPEIEPPFHVVVDYPDDSTQSPFVINPFVINTSPDNPFVINPFVINPFVINPFVINPFVINPFVINPSLADETDAVIDTTWTVSAGNSNTSSSYLPLVNIDNAENYLANGFSFQLIVYKGSLYGTLDGCESGNAAQPQILSNFYQDSSASNPFVINPFVINPFVINPFVINPFVINSTFTMAPSDDTPDGTTKAPPAPDEIKITLRAFKPRLPAGEGASTDIPSEELARLKIDPLPPAPIGYEPWVDEPSLVIVPLPCDTTDLDDPCFVTQAPDLVPGGIDEPSEQLTATVGGTLSGFPSTNWYVENQGYGEAAAENGPLEHGFFLCESVPAPQNELNLTDPTNNCVALTPKYVSTENPLTNIQDSNREYFEPQELMIPGALEGVSPGPWNIVVYVDDTFEISEFNEYNNWIAFPITIEEPNAPPEAIDTTYTTLEDTPVSAPFPASDPDGDPLTFTITTDPNPGTVVPDVPEPGWFTYTPDKNFHGTDWFVFEVSDGEFTVSATVTIDVTPVNDAPIAAPDSLTVEENSGPVAVDVLANDSDPEGDPLTVIAVGQAAHGETGLGLDGRPIYQPDPNFVGSDAFTYQVGDGTASSTGVVAVTVVDSVTDWLFIGYDNPWTPGYTVTAGSSIPLKWRYADPVTGALVNSSAGGTEVRITGWPETGCYSNGSTIYVVEDSGSSDLRYVNGSWQINWDTVGLPVGCYEVAVYHPTTHQLDTHNSLGQPLTVVLR